LAESLVWVSRLSGQVGVGGCRFQKIPRRPGTGSLKHLVSRRMGCAKGGVTKTGQGARRTWLTGERRERYDIRQGGGGQKGKESRRNTR